MKNHIIRELAAYFEAPDYQVARWSDGMVAYFLRHPHALPQLTHSCLLVQVATLLEAHRYAGTTP